ncbi:hypothetical protein H4W19_01655 [Pseudoxanthomonas mexicana]|uniref:Uncharacterized protein n=1 Tax=Pseudoxanthomonas mexicana TaxID=128785 RepID=A0ABX6REZ1_PSEMX|nr:hypothetical protein [Pseudoxanthomonas mexicana]QND80539.1 hypothetical protein H4W19_01655 [Pseudoxanthomonas mexicana]
MRSIVLSGLFLLAVCGSAEATIVRSDTTLVGTINGADKYVLGYVRWSAVGAFGYGKPFLFNYQIAVDGGQAILVCSHAPLIIGQKALVVIKQHEETAPVGCAKGATFIPMGRLDTFMYPVSSALDKERDWIAIPPALNQEVGCKVQTLDYDLNVKDGAGKSTRDYAAALSSSRFVLWQDLRKCL